MSVQRCIGAIFKNYAIDLILNVIEDLFILGNYNKRDVVWLQKQE